MSAPARHEPANGNADAGVAAAAPGAALVVIPTYDERENIEAIVRAVLNAVPEADVLVVDDASPDGTGALADRLAAADPRVRVLHRQAKRGLARALVAGYGYGLEHGYARVCAMDADFSHDPSRLPAVLGALDEADLAIGSRYVAGGGTRGWGLFRRLLSRGGSLYARWILGTPVYDLTGGFNALRADMLRAIDLGAASSTGYVFQIELKHRVRRVGGRIREVPIIFPDRREGRSKMTPGIALEALWQVWRLRFRLGGGRRLPAGRPAQSSPSASPPAAPPLRPSAPLRP